MIINYTRTIVSNECIRPLYQTTERLYQANILGYLYQAIVLGHSIKRMYKVICIK